MRSFFQFSHFSDWGRNFKYPIINLRLMCMKNDELDGEFDRLVEGRMKRLNGINLKEEIEFRENGSTMHYHDGDEVFGE
jgi:hypothetical protein